MSIQFSKAQNLASLSTTYESQFFHKPGERAAGPLTMLIVAQGQPATRGVFSIKQGSRFVRQDKLLKIVDEAYTTSGAGGVGPFAGTLTKNPAPTSLVITTQDDSGFSGAGEGAGLKFYTDNGSGIIKNSLGVSRGTINYFTKAVTVTFPAAVTAAQNIEATFWPAVLFEEGVQSIHLDGFQSAVKLEVFGKSETATMVAKVTTAGQWL